MSARDGRLSTSLLIFPLGKSPLRALAHGVSRGFDKTSNRLLYFVVGYFNLFQRVMPPATERTEENPACIRIPAAVWERPPDLQMQMTWRSRYCCNSARR